MRRLNLARARRPDPVADFAVGPAGAAAEPLTSPQPLPAEAEAAAAAAADLASALSGVSLGRRLPATDASGGGGGDGDGGGGGGGVSFAKVTGTKLSENDRHFPTLGGASGPTPVASPKLGAHPAPSWLSGAADTAGQPPPLRLGNAGAPGADEPGDGAKSKGKRGKGVALLSTTGGRRYY